jgi:hypothetical protein
MRPMRCLLVLLFCFAAKGQSLEGVVDIHVHSDPDSVPRSIDAVDIARLAQKEGMRALLLKSHYEPTASLAYLVRKAVPGVEAFGGVALNRSVGGINVAAVERMAAVKGRYGRVVWMPTFDSEHQVKTSKESRPFAAVSALGKLLPAVLDVLSAMGKGDLSLATGHSSPDEVFLLIDAAKKAGIQQIVVTHAMNPPVSMTIDQMKKAASLGAFLEFKYQAIVGPDKVTPQACADAIRAIGPQHVILSSDLGQPGLPLHTDGLRSFFKLLREHGFTQQEIELMSRSNPARFLGLGTEQAQATTATP